MPATALDPSRNFLCRSDFALLSIADERVAEWLATGSIERVGVLTGEHGTDPVFAVHSVDLREELERMLAAAGKTDVALHPMRARSELVRVLLAERGVRVQEPSAAAAATAMDPQSDSATDLALGDDDMFAAHAAEESLDATIDSISGAIEDLLVTKEPLPDDFLRDAVGLGPIGLANGLPLPPAESLAHGERLESIAAGDDGLRDDGTGQPGSIPTVAAQEDAEPTGDLATDSAAATPFDDHLGGEAGAAEVVASGAGAADATSETRTDASLETEIVADAGAAARDAGSLTGEAADQVLDAEDRQSGDPGPEPASEAPADSTMDPSSVLSDAGDHGFDELSGDEHAHVGAAGTVSVADAPGPAEPAQPPPQAQVRRSGDTDGGEFSSQRGALTESLQQIHLALLALAEKPTPKVDLATVVDAIEMGLAKVADSLTASPGLADVAERLDRVGAAMVRGSVAIAESLASGRAPATTPAGTVAALPTVPTAPARHGGTVALLAVALMIGGWVGAFWLHTGDPRTAMIALFAANLMGCAALLFRRA